VFSVTFLRRPPTEEVSRPHHPLQLPSQLSCSTSLKGSDSHLQLLPPRPDHRCNPQNLRIMGCHLQRPLCRPHLGSAYSVLFVPVLPSLTSLLGILQRSFHRRVLSSQSKDSSGSRTSSGPMHVVSNDYRRLCVMAFLEPCESSPSAFRHLSQLSSTFTWGPLPMFYYLLSRICRLCVARLYGSGSSLFIDPAH
jgi:hypothetical protein